MKYEQENVYLREVPWCRWCALPAQYDAEMKGGMAVFVCDLIKHGKNLTGRHRTIHKMREKGEH